MLELDADTAARGVLERLLGLLGEVVVLDTVRARGRGGCRVELEELAKSNVVWSLDLVVLESLK